MNETEAKNARLAEGKSVDDIKENLQTSIGFSSLLLARYDIVENYSNHIMLSIHMTPYCQWI